MKDFFLLWLPRIAGGTIALFVSVFALDAFSAGDWRRGIPDFLAHLVPALTLALVVLIAWRRPLFGAIAFLVLAAAYAATTQRLDWALVIAVPMAGAGVLYLAAWIRFRVRPDHG